MLQHEIFLENESKAMKMLMQGLTKTGEEVKPTTLIDTNKDGESTNFNFKLSDLQSQTTHKGEKRS